jgi:LuxR family maltose regulon positive regulatory protein
LEHASGLAERRKSIGYQVMAMLLQARVAVIRDDAEDALPMLALARRTLRAACVSGGLSEHVDAAKARVQLMLGERARALELARGVSGERGALLRAQLALANDDPVRAAQLVAAPEWSNVANHLEALLVRATVEADEAAARQLVVEAVERAADEGLVRPFLETGARVRDLALKAAERSPRPDAWDLGLAIRAGTVHTQSPVLLESLSARELDVLRSLRRPLTHEEIGRELFVSTNTVRTHVRGIYRKLGVNSRAEALARARALHVL